MADGASISISLSASRSCGVVSAHCIDLWYIYGSRLCLTGGGSTCAALAVCGVVDIEESVWAPRYGLKGMIDASISMRVQPLSAGSRHASTAAAQVRLLQSRKRASMAPQ